MIKKMIGNREISSLSVPERFFEYAHSYLEASIALCRWERGRILIINYSIQTENGGMGVGPRQQTEIMYEKLNLVSE